MGIFDIFTGGSSVSVVAAKKDLMPNPQQPLQQIPRTQIPTPPGIAALQTGSVSGYDTSTILMYSALGLALIYIIKK